METRHIKLDYEEALSAKKQLLTSELNLIQTEKKVRNYKLLRKKELTTKNLLRRLLRELRIKMNAIQSTLPEEEEPIKTKMLRRSIEKRKQEDIRKQLEEIEEKLARLS